MRHPSWILMTSFLQADGCINNCHFDGRLSGHRCLQRRCAKLHFDFTNTSCFDLTIIFFLWFFLTGMFLFAPIPWPWKSFDPTLIVAVPTSCIQEPPKDTTQVEQIRCVKNLFCTEQAVFWQAATNWTKANNTEFQEKYYSFIAILRYIEIMYMAPHSEFSPPNITGLIFVIRYGLGIAVFLA